jgi:hypothetical protein
MTPSTAAGFRRHFTAFWVLTLTSCTTGSELRPQQGVAPPGNAKVSAPPARRTPSAVPSTVPRTPPLTKVNAAARAYNLAADLAGREKELKDELGKRSATALAGEVFLLASPAGGGALSGPLDVTRRALEALTNGRFGRRPARAISVLLFPEARSYSAHCQKRYARACTSPYGFYVHSERRIVMNVGLGVGTLTHELVHPMVEADFPQAPDWLNEGIASLYEQFAMPKKGEIYGYKNWRHPRLLQGLRSKGEASQATPAALFVMSDDTFRGDREDLNYATARYFCQWLDQKGLLWSFYARYRDTYAADPSGRRAFTQTFGKAPEDTTAEWSRWVRAL